MSSKTIEGLKLFLKIGLLELTAYILICAATYNFVLYYSEKWRGEKFGKIRNLKELRPTHSELLLILFAFLFSIIAAYNEWKYIGP